VREDVQLSRSASKYRLRSLLRRRERETFQDFGRFFHVLAVVASSKPALGFKRCIGV
jgi:hypothetical protein